MNNAMTLLKEDLSSLLPYTVCFKRFPATNDC